MNNSGSFLSRFLNLGYSEPVYKLFKNEIGQQNRRMAETTSFIGSVMMILLSLTSFFVGSVSRVKPLYFVCALMFVAVYAAVKLFGKSSSVTLICNYAFLTVAFFFAMGLDIIQKNPTATTVCVLLVALPLLIVDKPYREIPYFFLISVCFMLESVFLKQSPKSSIDVLNSVCFFIIGSFLGYKHNQMMLRSMYGYKMLEKQRDTDGLTNLYNKGAMESKAKAFLECENVKGGLFVIDLDNFKYVNDTFGHHTGDEILVKLGTMLSSLFRTDDLLCRFGGDEFLVFLPHTNDKNVLCDRAEKILKGVEKIRIDADADYRAHVCIGISLYPDNGKTFEELFKCADTAMYLVKKHGKNGYGFYVPAEKQKILLVDDVEVNRVVLRETLVDEYEIIEAQDGEIAWEMLQNNKDVALIITDIQMPKMDGITFIRKVREDSRFDNVTIIADTQYGELDQEDEIMKLGVDDFVYKAASPAVIRIRVRNVLKAKIS